MKLAAVSIPLQIITAVPTSNDSRSKLHHRRTFDNGYSPNFLPVVDYTDESPTVEAQRLPLARAEEQVSIATNAKRAAPPSVPALTGPVHIGLVAHPGGIFREEAYIMKSTVLSQGMDKPFSTLLDTMREEYVVPSQFCETEDGCAGDPSEKYQLHGSYLRRGNPTPGQDSIEYDCYTDTVTVGNVLKADNCRLMVITKAPPENGMTSRAGRPIAIMGLSPYNNVQPQLLPDQPLRPMFDWFSLAVAEGKITPQPREFSTFYGRARTGTLGMSQITFGGRDERLFTGETTTFLQHSPVAKRHRYWQIDFFATQLGGQRLDSWRGMNIGPTLGVALNTVSPWITAPNNFVASIFVRINGAFPVNRRQDMLPAPWERITRSGLRAKPNVFRHWIMPCDARPIISLDFGDVFGPKLFDIAPEDLIIGRIPSDGFGFVDVNDQDMLQQALQGNTPICLLAIRSWDPTESARTTDPIRSLVQLGIPFLKNWYTTFTLPPNRQAQATISFAKAIQGHQRGAPVGDWLPQWGWYPADDPAHDLDAADLDLEISDADMAGPSNWQQGQQDQVRGTIDVE